MGELGKLNKIRILGYLSRSRTFCRSNFRIEFLVVPTVILSLVLNHEFSFMEILWTFSIYLESVAILPQLFMVQKTGEAESITSHYLFALGVNGKSKLEATNTQDEHTKRLATMTAK